LHRAASRSIVEIAYGVRVQMTRRNRVEWNGTARDYSSTPSDQKLYVTNTIYDAASDAKRSFWARN